MDVKMKSHKLLLLTIGAVFVFYSLYMLGFAIPEDQSGSLIEYKMISIVDKEEIMNHILSITDFKEKDIQISYDTSNYHMTIEMPHMEIEKLDYITNHLNQTFDESLLERGNLTIGATTQNKSYKNFVFGHYLIFIIGAVLIASFIVLRVREKKISRGNLE
ncbi:hypothetical protein EZV73_10115 [Acidaminobacter sp. JC074]|uniref:hypothetical protein n=1 Tax=Acidaminobacter sp. JC074 TaxID=2530199 RepID=UPI001F100057|nr:hypothetical protein [Acidaminobacter sp. JC074]MCH4887930.1 hypothetical protein [Acidaminobacter sp. JC074]